MKKTLLLIKGIKIKTERRSGAIRWLIANGFWHFLEVFTQLRLVSFILKMTMLLDSVVYECEAFVVYEHIELFSELSDTQGMLCNFEFVRKETPGIFVFHDKFFHSDFLSNQEIKIKS